MNIAKKIRALRMQRRLTLKETARRIGVPSSTYRDWEYGRKIRADKINQLAAAFEVSVAEITEIQDTSRRELGKVIAILEEALTILRKI